MAIAFAVIQSILYNSRTGLRRVFTQNSADVVFVFAHPDDETMFFLPTILQLKAMNVKFRLLCLSNGNFDRLGHKRVKELKSVAKYLGAVSCDIIDEPKLADGPVYWEAQHVAKAVELYLKKHSSIRMVFTFDDYGVSGHPNHISVSRGILAAKLSQPVYALKSVSIFRKYFPLLDSLCCLLFGTSEDLLAVNVWDPLQSLKTMLLYESQNVWYRKLFSLFSRYSYTNEFAKIA